MPDAKLAKAKLAQTLFCALNLLKDFAGNGAAILDA
jgi:hypothetical protein